MALKEGERKRDGTKARKPGPKPLSAAERAQRVLYGGRLYTEEQMASIRNRQRLLRLQRLQRGLKKGPKPQPGPRKMYGGQLLTEAMIRNRKSQNRKGVSTHWIELLPGGRFDQKKMERVGTGIFVWKRIAAVPRALWDKPVLERYDPYAPAPAPRPPG